MKSTPAAFNLLNQLWGCFFCQLLLGYQQFLSNCMASSYICAFNADRSCRAQLLMEHSYPFSHYCLLYVRSTRPEDNHQGLSYVCAHSVPNKENRPFPWKHLSNTHTHIWANKQRIYSLITLQMSPDMDVNTTPWEKWKLLKHVQSARARMHNFIWDHKTQIRCISRDSSVCQPVSTCTGNAAMLPLTNTWEREYPKVSVHNTTLVMVLFLWITPQAGEKVMSWLKKRLDILCFIWIFLLTEQQLLLKLAVKLKMSEDPCNVTGDLRSESSKSNVFFFMTPPQHTELALSGLHHQPQMVTQGQQHRLSSFIWKSLRQKNIPSKGSLL